MQKLNNIIFISIFLIVSCTKHTDFEGYWYGRYERDNIILPILVQLSDKKYIDYFAFPFDTFYYRKFGNKFQIKHEFQHPEYNFKITLKGNELLYYLLPSDTFIFKLNKSSSTNFFFDYLTEKRLKIDLPKGNGRKQVLGENHRIINPLYYTKIDNDLIINMNDTTQKLNSDFYKYLLNYKSKISSTLFSYSISLIADNKLTMNEIDSLLRQLSIACYVNIFFILHSDNYEKVNYFSNRLLVPDESEFSKYGIDNFKIILPPPQPPEPENEYLIKHGFFVEFSKGKILNNNKVISSFKFKELVKQSILSDSLSIVVYYIDNNSSYQDYIYLRDNIENVYFDLWDDYLLEKYSTNYRDIRGYDNRNHEAYKKYPLRTWRLDSTDYIKIKYALQHRI